MAESGKLVDHLAQEAYIVGGVVGVALPVHAAVVPVIDRRGPRDDPALAGQRHAGAAAYRHRSGQTAVQNDQHRRVANVRLSVDQRLPRPVLVLHQQTAGLGGVRGKRDRGQEEENSKRRRMTCDPVLDEHINR